MAQWGKVDNTSNSVLHAPTNVKLAPNSANRDALFGNTSQDAFVTDQAVGQFGVDGAELAAARGDGDSRPAHTGWVLRREGSGGRAGRVHYEVLVAGSITGDAEDVVFQDVYLVIDTQPTNESGNAVADDVVTFTSLAHMEPTGSVTYQWQFQNSTPDWEDLSDAGAYSNTATADLSVEANGVPYDETYRVVVSGSGANDKISDAVVIDLYPTITISGQPANASGNSTADDIVTFSVNAAAEGEAISYQWQFSNASMEWEDLADAGAYSNTTTATVSVLANTAPDQEVYRVVVTVDGTVLLENSGNATLTVTS